MLVGYTPRITLYRVGTLSGPGFTFARQIVTRLFLGYSSFVRKFLFDFSDHSTITVLINGIGFIYFFFSKSVNS
ncbi:hypothetical protein, partial [Citrobacter amalonaticus]|uniref:hypothetical protein n=1 Tax=Citrobacter amalonaticus TaxID=35703 RepID=UPI001E60117C